MSEAPLTFLNGRVTLHGGDCLEVARTLPDDSVDAIVTDPPYALLSSSGRGFMGKAWDTGERAFAVEFWAQMLRVLKPGGHCVAFGGTRTYHRLACAIEDAGFKIRDQLAWVYGSGFPKSLDVSKAIDKAAGAERKIVGRKTGRAASPVCDIRGGRSVGGVSGAMDCSAVTAPATDAVREWQGWGTALKPSWEPIVLARKPLSEGTVAANVLRWGCGGLNVDGCRIASETPSVERRAAAAKSGNFGRLGDKTNSEHGGFRANGDRHEGLMNYLNGKDGDALGRWPANIVHDGSEEVVGAFPVVGGGSDSVRRCSAKEPSVAKGREYYRESVGHSDVAGSPARFFYSAKANANDRIGSKHPTVKPVDLMQWLCRLVTPPGGAILDPFAGTGTTGEAAWREGFPAVLIERESEYRADIARRMEHALSGAQTRKAVRVKARGQTADAGPLFGGAEAAGGGAEPSGPSGSNGE